MSEFTKYAKAARDKGETALAIRLETEGKIVSRLIKHGLAAGYTVSVCDGEEWTVKSSRSYSDCMAACGTTDSDLIRFRNATGHKVGTVYLVYGNDGYDVISDYSSEDLDGFTAWLAPVDKYAESFDK